MNRRTQVKIDSATSSLMDAIRGVSALVVACVHAYQVFVLPYFGMGSRSQILTSLLATYAVNIFFIVSGFMICISTLRHKSPDGSFRSAEFAKARILRIYPPLAVAIILTVSIHLAIQFLGLHGSESYRLGGELFVARERSTIEWSSLPSTFFLLYGAVPYAPPPLNMDGPLWTLSYEWWFYVLAFLAARLWNGRTFSTLLPLGALVAVLLFGRNGLFLWFLLIWLSGFCLGYAYVNGQLVSARYWFVVATFALISLSAVFLLGQEHLLKDLLNPFDTSSAQIIMVGVSALVTLNISVLVRSATSSTFQAPTSISKLAEFSYTLYVIHYPLLLLGFSLFHPLLHAYNWTTSLFAAMAILVPIVYVSSRVALVVENRTLLNRLASPATYLPQKT